MNIFVTFGVVVISCDGFDGGGGGDGGGNGEGYGEPKSASKTTALGSTNQIDKSKHNVQEGAVVGRWQRHAMPFFIFFLFNDAVFFLRSVHDYLLLITNEGPLSLRRDDRCRGKV